MNLFSEISKWASEGLPIAICTVIQTWGSAPLGAGAKMAVNQRGEHIGSLSGGCVEADAIMNAMEVMDSQVPKLIHYSVSDETAFDVGLACGGQIDIYIEPLTKALLKNMPATDENEGRMHLTCIKGDRDIFGQKFYLSDVYPDNFPAFILLGSLHINLAHLSSLLKESLQTGNPKIVQINQDRSIEVFVEPFLPPYQLIIIGANQLSVELSKISSLMGFRTIVIDPRRAFANQDRFAPNIPVINKWPEIALEDIRITHRSALAILTHDPKIDDQALMIGLQTPAFYIGALGSTKTNKERTARLIQQGADEDALQKIHAPIGLEIGNQNMEELALSIMAEIIAVKNNGLSSR